MLGVSLIVCCHNSAAKLPQTIKHVNELAVSGNISWEFIIVDNASTDGTSQLATQLLSPELKSIAKIVMANKLGLKNARLKGIEEAQYEYICFIDDDNWICPDWINIVYEVLTEHPDVGACGGRSLPEFENCIPPEWFDEVKESFAVGEQGAVAGYVQDTRGYLWGAGLTIRRTAWDNLFSNGFDFALTGRKGKSLSSGEDAELCFALRLAGWKLYYEPRLVFKHVMSADRLQWQYFRRLTRAFGGTALIHGAYANEYANPCVLDITYLTRELRRVISEIKIKKTVVDYYDTTEGSHAALSCEYMIGYLLELIRSRIFARETIKQFEIIKRISGLNAKNKNVL